MKFKGKNYFKFVIPSTILFIIIYSLGIAPQISNEKVASYIFMFGIVAISFVGIYLAIRDEDVEKKKKQQEKKANFPDMKTNYKNLNKK